MTAPWFLGFPDITAWHIFILKYYLFIWHSPSSGFSPDVLSLITLLQPPRLSVDELFSLRDTLPQSLSLWAPFLGCNCSQLQCDDLVWNRSSLSSHLPLIHPWPNILELYPFLLPHYPYTLFSLGSWVSKTVLLKESVGCVIWQSIAHWCIEISWPFSAWGS